MEGAQRKRASKIVRLLREDILRREEGAFIGSEEDLLSRYQVSRQTLRQAARVLENEQLLRVRRGVHGGYFVRRPTLEAVGRGAATYLRIRQITLDDVLEADDLISPVLSRKAALCGDERLRAELAELGRKAADGSTFAGPAEFLSWDVQAARLISQLAGNPALEFMISVFTQIGIEESMVYARQPGRIGAWVALRRKLIGAILDRDPEVAEIYALRGIRQFREWIAEDREAP
jgi:DNA-binding FadR family transcriptional regulator